MIVGSIVLVGAFTHCVLLLLICNLKATEMNVQCSLIQELIIYKFILEATKNICCLKGEIAIDHSIVHRWFKKFHTDCKDLNNRSRSGRPKTVDSKVMLQAMAVNPVNIIGRACGLLNILQSNVVHHFPFCHFYFHHFHYHHLPFHHFHFIFNSLRHVQWISLEELEANSISYSLMWFITFLFVTFIFITCLFITFISFLIHWDTSSEYHLKSWRQIQYLTV